MSEPLESLARRLSQFELRSPRHYGGHLSRWADGTGVTLRDALAAFPPVAAGELGRREDLARAAGVQVEHGCWPIGFDVSVRA